MTVRELRAALFEMSNQEAEVVILAPGGTYGIEAVEEDVDGGEANPNRVNIDASVEYLD